MTHHHETAKELVDWLAIGLSIGALVKLLPAIAAGFSIIWTAIRIYETRTVQRILGKSDER